MRACSLTLLLAACAADPLPMESTETTETIETTEAESQAPCVFGAARWGAGDEAGQSNTQTPAKAAQAAKLIRSGRVWSLAHELREDMPVLPFPGLFGYQQSIVGPLALGTTIAQEEQVMSEIGQVATQMDALGHMCWLQNGATDPLDALCYNGFTVGDVVTPDGLVHLGVENIKPYFTRGFLLDVARYANGGQRMAPGQPVTAAMILTTLAAQKLKLTDIEEGDVVLVRTGHEDLWTEDPAAYYGATPGLDLGAAQLLSSRCIGNVGVDNWPVDVQPPVDVVPSGSSLPVHEHNLSVAGLPQLENLALRRLADDLAAEFAEHPNKRVYRFAFIHNPVPLGGATGSPAAPLAVK